MSSYGHIFIPKREIQVPKSPILAALVPNHTLKRREQNFFVDQNDCLVKIIKGEKRIENLRCGAAMVTKIVKNA